MTAQPLLPKNAPFTPEDIDALNSVVARTTPQQRAWLAGFFAGFEAAQAGGGALPQAAVASKPRQALTVLYASESGNAEALAMRTKKLAQKHGLDAKIVDFADADFAVLSKAKNLIVFASTWGEGDPPGRAVDFYTALMSEAAPRIEGVRFAVLALGRHRLRPVLRHRQGDRRASRRRWAARAPSIASTSTSTTPSRRPSGRRRRWASWRRPTPPATPRSCTSTSRVSATQPTTTSRNSPPRTRSPARSRRWSTSTAQARRARPGTSRSPPRRRASPICRAMPSASCPRTIRRSRWSSPRQSVSEPTAAVVQKLRERYDVTTLSRALVENYAKLTQRIDLTHLADPKAFTEFAEDRQLVDLFERYPEKLNPEQLFGLLRPLPGPALLRRLEPQGAPGRGASSGRCRALGILRQEARRRRLHLLRRPPARRRSGAHLREAEPPLPPARGRQPPDRHDRRRHRRRALPRLHRGPRRGRRQGQELAVLRRAQLHQRLPLPARVAGGARVRHAVAHRRRLLARSAGEDLRAAAAVGARATTY